MAEYREKATVSDDQPADRPGGHPTRAAELSHGAYAGLISRLAALALDVMIVTLGAAIGVGLAVGGAEVMLGRVPLWVQIPTTIAVGLLPVAYFTGAWWLLGQTFGAMALGLAIRDAATRPLRFPRALVRAVAGLALAPIWLIGMALILFDTRRRALLDVVVGTIVIYVPDRGAGSE